MTIPTLFNKALCWNYIKRRQGIKYSLKDSFERMSEIARDTLFKKIIKLKSW